MQFAAPLGARMSSVLRQCGLEGIGKQASPRPAVPQYAAAITRDPGPRRANSRTNRHQPHRACGLMVIQEHADLIFPHYFGGAQTRQVAMKPLQALQQGIRRDIDLHRKTLAVEAPQAP
jgi:hypothetical protein